MSTLYQRLRVAYGDDLFDKLDGPNTRCFGPGLADNDGADPMAGLVYRTDYRAEEEFGVGELRLTLTGKNDRNFTITAEGRTHVRRFSDVNALLLSNRWTLPDGPLCWNGLLDEFGRASADGTPDYASSYEQSMPYAQGAETGLRRRTMSELRPLAKELGIKPLPKSKAAMLDAIYADPQFAARRTTPHQWPGWFQDGKDLVLRADDGPAADLLRHLGEAADDGFLGVGSASGPFSTGIFFYDVREESESLKAKREAAFDFYDEHMLTARKIEREMVADGYRIYFLGRPSVLSTAPGEEKALKFFLNAGQPNGPQVYGWFTADQLRERTFPERVKS